MNELKTNIKKKEKKKKGEESNMSLSDPHLSAFQKLLEQKNLPKLLEDCKSDEISTKTIFHPPMKCFEFCLSMNKLGIHYFIGEYQFYFPRLRLVEITSGIHLKIMNNIHLSLQMPS